jgi:RND family efflux transporter MFP subunit
MRWLLILLAVACASLVSVAALFLWRHHDEEPYWTSVSGYKKERKSRPVMVEVVRPSRQSFDRRVVQPGSLAPYESVDLYAEASGVLKTLMVDLGDRVKAGSTLAEIHVPELRKEREKACAHVDLSRARLKQAEKSLKKAKADLRVARAAVPKAEAGLQAAKAFSRFREKSHKRILALWESRAVEERLVDESEERRESALASERAADLGLDSARAQADAAEARVEQAEADIAEAQASVGVALAELERIEVLISFSKIVAPFDGQITRRNVFPGAYIRSAREGGVTPLLSLERTDKLRVIVQIPDKHVPFADVGDRATIEVETLGKSYDGRISRTQGAEDTLTRTMRVEIDLDNKTGELRPGMFGKVDIVLQHAASAVTIPSACLVGEVKDGVGAVYVVEDNKARLTQIRIGSENGELAEVLGGVTEVDLIIRRHSGPISDGSPVQVPKD